MHANSELSPQQARKIVLLSQGIHKASSHGQGKKSVLNAIEHLGYIQIDTISVVERAHHHSLWNRVSNYQKQHLQNLISEKQVFEYWSHAAAYLPMRDFRFSLPRKHAIAAGEKHWFDKDKLLTSYVLDRIRAEGPLRASDFEHKQNNDSGWWQWKPAKKALEQLFIEGELMVVERRGFQKVYDLTERVLPDGLDTSTPSHEEYCQHLINNYLKAHGLAKLEHIGYLLKGMKNPLKQQAEQMLEEGVLACVNVGREQYLALPNIEQMLGKKLSRSKVKILSPFDNLLIQRKRTKELFGYDYQIECYVPAAKRKYGYFCLPVLWGHEFAGRIDAKIDRKTGLLNIIHLHIETNKVEQLLSALKPTLLEFMAFNLGTHIKVHKISNASGDFGQACVDRYNTQLHR